MGYILAASTAVPCLLAAICFYISGTYYVEFKKKLVAEKEAAMVVAEKEHIELRSESIAELQVMVRSRRLDSLYSKGGVTREQSATLPFKMSRPKPIAYKGPD